MTRLWLDHGSIFRCPITSNVLTPLDDKEIATINHEIELGVRVHRDGSTIEVPVKEQAVGTPERTYVYRIEDEILWFLPSLAMVLKAKTDQYAMSQDGKSVQHFYDERGWVRDVSGKYIDTLEFTSTTEQSVAYMEACNKRVNRYLRAGRYILDAASGAIPSVGYLSYSDNYDFRVCVDFSILALQEAKQKLAPGKGLFVLGDLTALPFTCDAIDDAISLHTVYHISPDMQARAVDELVRVVRTGGRVVIVYSWSHSALMSIAHKFRHRVAKMRGRLAKPLDELERPLPDRDLYFRPLTHGWFVKELRNKYHARLKVFASVDAQFQERVFSRGVFGRTTSKIVLIAETHLSSLLGRYGQYPLFIIDKPRHAVADVGAESPRLTSRGGRNCAKAI